MTRRPIFIGGVGRTGTTVLKNALAAHPDVHAFKGEIRWLSDPDGLACLFRALRDSWTPFVGDLALKRFKATCLDTLRMQYVANFGFRSGDPLIRMIDRISQHPSMARYYGWRDLPIHETDPIVNADELPGIIQDFFEQIFDQAKIQQEYWVEDTPENVCHFNTYREIFGPDTPCFHAVRHPMDTIASIKGRNSRKDFSQIWWWPKEPRLIARRIRYIHDHWAVLQHAPGFVVRLEELAVSPEATVRDVCAKIGIDYDPVMIEEISDKKAHAGRWKDDLTKEEVRECKLVVAPVMRTYGYTLD